MSEPRALAEHFFRHEFGRLVAVLTRSLGARRLALVGDVAGAALVQVLETWFRRGVSEDLAGWLNRAACNPAIDALWRKRTHAQALPRLGEDAEREGQETSGCAKRRGQEARAERGNEVPPHLPFLPPHGGPQRFVFQAEPGALRRLDDTATSG